MLQEKTLKIFSITVGLVFALSSGVQANWMVSDMISETTWGVEGGVNLASFSGDGNTLDWGANGKATSKQLTGFSIGAVGTYNQNDNIDLIGRIGVSQVGQKYAVNDTAKAAGKKDLTAKITYLKGSGDVSYKLPQQIANASVALQGGMYGAYKVSDSIDKEVSAGASKVDFGIRLGSTVSIPVNNSDINVSIGYEKGLRDIITTTKSKKAKNQNIQIAVGTNF